MKLRTKILLIVAVMGFVIVGIGAENLGGWKAHELQQPCAVKHAGDVHDVSSGDVVA